MKKLACLTLAMISLNSFASSLSTNEIDVYETMIFESSISKTRYETLIETYNNTKIPASLEDFRTRVKCLAAKTNYPNHLIEVGVAIQGKIIEPATPERTLPSAGPMFPAETIPAKPAVIGDEKLVVGVNAGNYSLEFFEIFQNISEKTEFIVYVPKNNKKLFGDIGPEVQIKFRKDIKTGYFPFIITKLEQPVGNTDIYAGYCY
jgi:hypothetical protein